VWAFGGFASIATAAIVANMFTAMLRRLVYNKEDFDKHVKQGDMKSYLFGLGVSQSGLGGVPDPYIQALSNLRYTQDTNSLLQGPSIKYVLSNANDILRGVANTEGDVSGTNTRYYNATKAAYDLVAVPSAAFIATQIAGFGLTIPSAAFAQYATSPHAAEQFATMMTGRKGTKLPAESDTDPYGMPTEIPGMPTYVGGQLPGESGSDALQGSDQQPTGVSGAQGASSIPWGLMDDVLVPAWRAAAPVVAKLPGPVKWGAAAVTAAALAAEYWKKTAPYRAASQQQQEQEQQQPETLDAPN
jgi:hypothetical protein